MAAKLKLISNQTPWFLAVKALALSLVWHFLPFSVFLILFLLFYFIPFFKPSELGAPFLTVLTLTFFLEKGFWPAVFVAVSVYMILGIKDLIFINRKSSYETLIFVLFLALFSFFFSNYGNWFGTESIFWSLAAGFLVYALMRGFINYEGVISEELEEGAARHKFMILALAAFLLWQILWVLIFLPIGSIYQSAVLFLVSVIFLEFVLAYLNGKLTARRVLLNFTVFFVFIVFILTSTRWEL